MNKDLLTIIIMVVVVLGIGSTGFFWFNLEEGCFDPLLCDSNFDAHGFSGTEYLIFSIIVLELIYIIFLSKCKKDKNESWYSHAAWLKLASLLCLAGLYVIIIPFISLLTNKITFYIVNGIAVLGILYLLNVALAKMINNKEVKKKK